jgi:hypothetical protein
MYANAYQKVSGIHQGSCVPRSNYELVASPPNSALQRTAGRIKCSAAGGRAKSAHERYRARVLSGWRAVAELGS